MNMARLVLSLLRSLVSAIALLPLQCALTFAVEPVSSTHFDDVVRPSLVQLCGECHSPNDEGNNLRFLEAESVDDLERARGDWHSVAEQLRNRTMPPAEEPQPTEQQRLELSAWIDATLRATACSGGEFAGSATPRRLNRYEYERTIRDLTGVDYRATQTFPTDGSGGEGFNNNGETLFLPPMLMERYLTAAGEILDEAVISSPLRVAFGPRDFLPERNEASTDRVERLLQPREEAAAFVTIYRTGDYHAAVTARASGKEHARLVLKIDGIPAERWTVKPSDGAEPDSHETTIHLQRGVHALSVRVGRESGPARLLQLTLASPDAKVSEDRRERHGRLLLTAPGETLDAPRAKAREVLERFTRRAFRRPVEPAEINRLMTLYDRGAHRGDPLEESLKLALKAVLVSPHFLFRIEADPQSTTLERIGDHELATRLSYFLWSSMPDEQLDRLADSGRLNDPEELRRQVDRMLDDSRSLALADQFVGQWLGTHEVGARVAPSTDTFKKEFTSKLLLDMHDEPIYFFRHLVASDGSLLNLLDCDYAVVNQRLAEHYGFTAKAKQSQQPVDAWAVESEREFAGRFELVSLPDDRRGGVLGMGGVHLLTSYPNRTSPVLRGAWVLETLLGIRVPSPPPDVPELKRGKKETKSLREQLAQHRENPTCAACHNLMDPLGFALENFDVLSRWREKDGDAKIDASASLPSGETFTGPAELRQVLMQRKSEFTRQATRKMLGYALGRSLEDADDCTIEKVTSEVAGSDYRVRALVHAIVQSKPFRFRQSVESE